MSLKYEPASEPLHDEYEFRKAFAWHPLADHHVHPTPKVM